VPRLVALTSLALLLAAAPAVAGADTGVGDCHAALDELGVSYHPVKRRGIADGVEVSGPIGGVTYQGYGGDPLVLDCSLVFSLARAGQFLLAQGVVHATYSSAYQRRNIRHTNRPSRHSYGLALDVHTFELSDASTMAVRDDYEQGLGDADDCMGEPLSELGTRMRAIDCTLSHSGLFRIVLDPDYDQDHYNHFHLEARPWQERDDRDPRGPLTAGWAAVESTSPRVVGSR
jgi:hypothetical protein